MRAATSSILLLAGLLAGGLPLRAAEKSDLVVMRNGDHLTGEVKGLEQGRLSFKTDHMGTVSIEWDEIEELTSAQSFEVELETGDKFFGALGPAPEEGTVRISGESETAHLELSRIVRIVAIEASFLKRLDGSLDVGFNVTRANRETQLTVGAEVGYRTRKLKRGVKLSSTLSDQQDAERTRRNSVEGEVVRFLSNRRFALGMLQFQENEELDLELRSLLVGGMGRHVIQTGKMELNLFLGLALNRERFKRPSEPVPGGGPEGDGEPRFSFDSTEAVGGLQFALFKLDDPETDVRLNITLFPSLTFSSRLRTEADARLRRELVKDLFLNVSLYTSSDSEPPVEGFAGSDWGLSTSVGWSF